MDEPDKQSLGIGKGTPGPGRPKGSLNKATRSAKDAIAAAAEELGGAERLVAWVKLEAQNERIFWGQIYPKLLPLTVGGDADNPVKLVFGWMSEE